MLWRNNKKNEPSAVHTTHGDGLVVSVPHLVSLALLHTILPAGAEKNPTLIFMNDTVFWAMSNCPYLNPIKKKKVHTLKEQRVGLVGMGQQHNPQPKEKTKTNTWKIDKMTAIPYRPTPQQLTELNKVCTVF